MYVSNRRITRNFQKLFDLEFRKFFIFIQMFLSKSNNLEIYKIFRQNSSKIVQNFNQNYSIRTSKKFSSFIYRVFFADH